jgi:hypothetical protein
MRGDSEANFCGAGMALTTVNGVDLRGLDFESVIAQVLNPKIIQIRDTQINMHLPPCNN